MELWTKDPALDALKNRIKGKQFIIPTSSLDDYRSICRRRDFHFSCPGIKSSDILEFFDPEKYLQSPSENLIRARDIHITPDWGTEEDLYVRCYKYKFYLDEDNNYNLAFTNKEKYFVRLNDLVLFYYQHRITGYNPEPLCDQEPHFFMDSADDMYFMPPYSIFEEYLVGKTLVCMGGSSELRYETSPGSGKYEWSRHVSFGYFEKLFPDEKNPRYLP